MSEVIVTTGPQAAQPESEPKPSEPTPQPQLINFKIKSTGMKIEMGPPMFPIDIYAPQFVQMPNKDQLSAGDLASYSQQLQAIEAVLYVRKINNEQTVFPQNQTQFLQICTKLGDVGVRQCRKQYVKEFVNAEDDDIEVIKKNL